MMDKQKFYKRELRDSVKYIHVLHMADEVDAEVLLVHIATPDYLSEYKLSWVTAKWERWTPISKQEFFAAMAEYAAIDAELGN